MSSTMALARAFTKRVKRSSSDANTSPSRSASARYPRGTINRGQISLPTELISTTNVQALTAPMILSVARSSSGSSLSSGSESEFSSIDRSFLERSADDSGYSTPLTPPTDEFGSFFDMNKARSESPEPIISMLPQPPVLPHRAPSHSKKAHVELSRKRSLQRMSPPPTSLGHSMTPSSAGLFTATDANHPFVRELAQVNEVAEEFGAMRSLLDAEEQDLYNKGLHKFSVDDYLDEIAGLSGGIFENQLGLAANQWL